MHLVVLNLRLAYGAEGTKAYMQRYKNLFAADFLDFLQQLFGKVQACSRSGSTAALTVINSLIALLILQRCRDIRRQRSFTQTVKNFFEDTVILKSYHTSAEVGVLDNLAAQFIAKVNLGTNLQFFAGAYQNLPVGCISAGQQKYFNMGTGILRAVQARGNNAGIIKHQHVTGLKIIYQVIKMPVLNFPSLFVNHQQTRMVARLHRMLSNKLLWQIIIKISY